MCICVSVFVREHIAYTETGRRALYYMLQASRCEYKLQFVSRWAEFGQNPLRTGPTPDTIHRVQCIILVCYILLLRARSAFVIISNYQVNPLNISLSLPFLFPSVLKSIFVSTSYPGSQDVTYRSRSSLNRFDSCRFLTSIANGYRQTTSKLVFKFAKFNLKLLPLLVVARRMQTEPHKLLVIIIITPGQLVKRRICTLYTSRVLSQ